MVMLVTLEQAFRHLRLLAGEMPDPIEDHDDADEVAFKATHASGIVLDHCTDKGKEEWTDADVPAAVQAAVLVVLSDLWEHRAGSSEGDVFLSAAAKSLLKKYRDPTLA